MNRQLPELLAVRLAGAPAGPAPGRGEEPQPGLWRHQAKPADARPAAVLVLLYPHEDRWHVPLTLRPTGLPVHGGQVSLPGGAVQPGESPAQAAIREFHEELGAAGHPIRLLGRLSPIYVKASHFRVEPWVAATDHRPEMVPNPAEVERLLEVPLSHLLDPANFGRHQREDQGQKYLAPHFWFPPYRIWGATCMILGELVSMLEALPSGV
ncbi:MAG: NUDIX hydrolase [Thermoguttaceae bacterium]